MCMGVENSVLPKNESVACKEVVSLVPRQPEGNSIGEELNRMVHRDFAVILERYGVQPGKFCQMHQATKTGHQLTGEK